MLKIPTLCILALLAGFSPAICLAEGGGGNQDWAEKAALQYEEKAATAQANGDIEDAAIYKKMAQIKRDAGAAAKTGKSFSWDEYHALNAQLKGPGKHTEDKGKAAKSKDESGDQKAESKDHAKSDDEKSQVEKQVKDDPGAGFINTAQEYQKQSIEAAKAGDTEKANIYMELAKIKLDAAAAVRQGKDFDWTKYHELVKRLNQ